MIEAGEASKRDRPCIYMYLPVKHMESVLSGSFYPSNSNYNESFGREDRVIFFVPNACQPVRKEGGKEG